MLETTKDRTMNKFRNTSIICITKTKSLEGNFFLVWSLKYYIFQSNHRNLSLLISTTDHSLSSLPIISQTSPNSLNMTHPHEEYSHVKELKKYNNMLGCIADTHYGIPTRCPCGGRIVDEVSPGKKFPGNFDTLPGRKYFTCDNFEVLFRY